MTGVVYEELESARVARILRTDILVGRRRPGSRLVEREIAAELGVSRLPVREAIRALVAEGIVISRPRSWAVVRQFTFQDIQDFAEVREAIETQVFVLAAERHDERGLALLRRALEAEEAAAEQGDFATAREQGGDFHELTVHLAGNKMLLELVGVFVTRLRWLFGQHEDLTSMVAEHRRLYDAIAARDTELVRTLIIDHMAKGRVDAERRLRESSGFSI